MGDGFKKTGDLLVLGAMPNLSMLAAGDRLLNVAI